jgi:hypothetical protein
MSLSVAAASLRVIARVSLCGKSQRSQLPSLDNAALSLNLAQAVGAKMRKYATSGRRHIGRKANSSDDALVAVVSRRRARGGGHDWSVWLKRTVDDAKEPSEVFVELKCCAIVLFGGHCKGQILTVVRKAASRLPWLTATTAAVTTITTAPTTITASAPTTSSTSAGCSPLVVSIEVWHEGSKEGAPEGAPEAMVR